MKVQCVRMFAALVVACGVSATVARAQAPCTVKRAVIDSARSDILSVFSAGGPLVTELRQEQGLTKDSIVPTTVTDRAVCARMAPAFARLLPPNSTFAVLRLGNVYYARDPDQKRSTGVITDTSYNVLMRLGAELPDPATRPAVRSSTKPTTTKPTTKPAAKPTQPQSTTKTPSKRP